MLAIVFGLFTCLPAYNNISNAANAGETVDITLSISGVTTAYSRLMINVMFDKSVYTHNNNTGSVIQQFTNSSATYASGIPDVLRNGGTFSTFSPMTIDDTVGARVVVGGTSTSTVVYNGNLCTISLKLYDNAPTGDYPIYLSLNAVYVGGSAKLSDGDLATFANSITLSVTPEIIVVGGGQEPSDTTPPILTAGTPTRTSDTTATVKFTSNEAGAYYYAVVATDEYAPTIDATSEGGAPCTTAETTISLTDLTTGAKDIYIVVKDAAGNVSTPATKITIPEFDSGGGTQPGAITVTDDYGGTHSNDNGVYTFAPQTGYKIYRIYVDGVSYDETNVYNKTTYTLDTTIGSFTDVKSIVATYAHTINFNTPSNGSLSVRRGANILLTSEDIVHDGETLTITVTPASNYELDAFLLIGFENNNPEANPVGTYTVTVLAERGEATPQITASFKQSGPVTTNLDRPQLGYEHNISSDSIILTAPGASLQDESAVIQYRYRTGVSGSPWSNWQDEPAFYGLISKTSYVFQARYVASDTALWDNSDPSSEFWTMTADTLHTLSVTQPEHGIIGLSAYSANSGASIQVTVIPDDGYRVASIFRTGDITGNSVDIYGAVVSFGTVQRLFGMLGEAVTVSAVIEKLPGDPEAVVWSGAGTAVSPWLISTAEDMRALSEAVNGGAMFANKHFRLQNDIALGNWTPIGNYTDSKLFSGTFDGYGHSLTINVSSDKDGAGLFGYVLYGTVKNLTVRGSVSAGRDRDMAAGVVGYAESATIETCVNYAAVTLPESGSEIAGGIVGGYSGDVLVDGCQNFGKITVTLGHNGTGGGIVGGGNKDKPSSITIRDSKNYGVVSIWAHSAGGIIGIVSGNAVIDGCENNALVEVTAGYRAGGIVGATTDTGGATIKISNSGNSAAIKAYGSNGGILGLTFDSAALLEIDGCWNSGYIYGENSIGGILGQISNSTTATKISVAISNVYNTGEIEEKVFQQTTTAIGGIIGLGRSQSLTLTNAYHSGTIKFTHPQYVGGLIGQAQSQNVTVTNGYYLNALAGAEPSGDYGIAKTADELKSLAETLEGAFAPDTNNKNGGYPILKWQAEAVTHTVSFRLTGGDANAKITVNEQPVTSLTATEGSYAVFDVTTGASYKVGSVTAGDTDLTPTSTADLTSSYSYRVTGDVEIVVAIIAREASEIKPEGGGQKTSTVPQSQVWDGVTVDLTWFDPAKYDATSSYSINSPAQLAGLAALVNGLVNANCNVYLWDGSEQSAAQWNAGEYVKTSTGSDGGQGNNISTDTYHYGAFDFNGKTVTLAADVDMGGVYNRETRSWSGPNYMPVGGQYLMRDEDPSTKLSSSFNGTFDGGGHYVYNIYAERHCASAYGDGQSVGLIGRLGCHDNDPVSIRANTPTVKNVAVTGYIHANRSVGGIVGKIGKTNAGGYIENCANFATIIGTDAKGTGGIVGAGWNGGAVTNCYNAGSVTGGWPSGGIVGSNEITIENCYNIGQIGSTAGDNYAQSIGTYNGSWPDTRGVVNCYFLENTAANGGYYKQGGSVDNTVNSIEFKETYMKSDEFVAKLGAAYVKDTRNINNGYPILEWQGGTAVDPGTTPGTDDAKTTDRPETEAVTDVAVKDGEAVVTVKVPEKSAETTDTPERLVVNVDTKGETVSKITVEIPKEVIALESGSKSEIEIRSEVANVLLPEKAVAALAVTGEAVTVKAAKNDDKSYTFTVAAGEKSIEKLDGGIKAVIPAEDATPGTVAVIVHADGTEEVIKKSVGKDGKVSIPLDGSATIKIVDNAKDFADVSSTAWYSDGVKFTSSHELFQGTDDGGFAPEMSMTRGMLATVLHRLENAPTATGELFADVAEGAYYAEAIIWASANSIVNGTGNGFAPDAEINREQLAVMLYRYYVWTFAGDGGRPGTVAATDANLSAFPDADGVSDWAEDAVIWAVGIGLIQGRDSGLVPKGAATRAEVAVILERFIENIL
jgi:hypothetical protein